MILQDVAPADAVLGMDTIETEYQEPAVSTPEEKQEDVEIAGIGHLPQSETTQQDAEVFFPLDGEWDTNGTFLIGQADTQDRASRAIAAMPNLDLTDTESGREWVDYMRESMISAPNKDQWRAAVDRDGSEWRQGVKSERGNLAMGAMSFKNVSGELLTGEKAVLQVRALLGLGSTIQVPLWHSGFHITIKAPSEIALLELNRRLMDEKIVMGRTTNGLAFANTASYLNGGLLDFAMEHVYDTSLQEKDMARIKAMIETPDLPLLFWGLACAIWPRGFQYARPYLDPITNEEKMLREKLAVGKLLFVDTKALTPWQISHMAHRGSGTMTADAVKRYKTEFTVGQPRRVQLSEHIAVTLKVPSANDYVISGYKWIGEITRVVDEAFQLPPEDQRRTNFIVQHGKATNMRQYIHWVAEIHPGAATITDRETIEKIIDDLSSNDEVRRKYFDEVKKFIDDSTMAVIATPTANTKEEKQLPRFPHLLPMNVEQTFFTLLEQKISQISLRN
ncbi:hypothetical protein AWB81_04257 [Caballeronia arationis]|uniref:hypothetical protein n=1 Tax=Caballeronia arationis TaxID=1777142 RepID=UPI00074D1C72|nr:hypothetical protein [Caballeronia arationis]SAK83981.1 hypothetical protein AWB81_04257 [Caballeronia arationis]